MKNLVKICLLLLTVLSAAVLSAREINANWKIVCGKVSGSNEKRARNYLRAFLIKMTGKRFDLVDEKKFSGKTPAIYFGDTAYARKNGIDQSKLDDELWIIKAMPDGNLLISGGKARGILYAVYDFVELAGARFFTAKTRILPELDKITIPDDLNIRKKPFFAFRSIYTATSQYDLYSWHKLNPNVRDMGFRIHGTPHSFSSYTKDFPENKELYALSRTGKRVLARNHREYGQVCLTHPEVRRLFKEKLRKNIAQEKIDAARRRQSPAKYYRITPNDNGGYCYCENCKKAVKKYGAMSGLLLEFISDIARDFPDIKIVTFAYNETLVPPNPGSIKPAPNICIEIAQLAPDKRELLLPLSHEANKEARERIQKWSKFTNYIMVWDYFKVYTQPHPSPYTALPAICENMPFYAKNNVQWFFAESEFTKRNGCNDSHAFQDLEIYVAMKLMVDPFLDPDNVIRDFMEKYYGPAAKDMTAYLNYIIKRQKSGMPPGTYHRSFADSAYFDREFFAVTQKLLADALKKTKGTQYYDRVVYERIIVDSAQLYLMYKLEKQSGPALVSKEEIKKRIYEEGAAAAKRWKPQNNESARLHQLCALEKLNIPQELRGKRIKFLESAGVKLKQDPDSPTGSTAYLSNVSPKEEKIIFGVFDFSKRERLCKDFTILRADFPQDEKYHFYKIATVKPRKKCYVFGHRSWRMNYFFFNRVEQTDLDKNYDIWVSMKITGPAYVKNSKSVNSFCVDQVLMVESN